MNAENNMSFERAIERLDEVIGRLSRGDAGLEESMELYCEGAEMLAFCEKKLDDAKLKTEKLFAGEDPGDADD